MSWSTLVLVGSLLVAPVETKKDASTKDLDKFKGEWVIQAAHRDGKEMPAAEIEKVKVLIEGNKITIKDGTHDEVATIKLDPSKKPATIDIIPEKAGKGQKTVLGIYQFDSGVLKMAWAKEGGERPKEFVSKEGTGINVMILKRGKN
jgi:uncharacterized protein (TIGR03067 family)